jgi:hypothetical protein
MPFVSTIPRTTVAMMSQFDILAPEDLALLAVYLEET